MIVFNHPGHGEMIARAAGLIFHPGEDMVISRQEGSELYGGCIFNAYTIASMCIHIAGFRKNWGNRDLLWVCFHYPFEQLKVKKLIIRIPSFNTESLALSRNLGFREIITIKDVYPNGDVVVLEMYKDECRFLKVKPRNLQVGSSHKIQKVA